jgi:hypothetical protein
MALSVSKTTLFRLQNGAFRFQNGPAVNESAVSERHSSVSKMALSKSKTEPATGSCLQNATGRIQKAARTATMLCNSNFKIPNDRRTNNIEKQNKIKYLKRRTKTIFRKKKILSEQTSLNKIYFNRRCPPSAS